MSLLDGVHASFEIFGILYEQLSQFKVEIVKVGKILGCLNFGSADGPRVRSGQSAIVPRTVRQMHRQASVTPMVCPLSKRGWSAKDTRTVRSYGFQVDPSS